MPTKNEFIIRDKLLNRLELELGLPLKEKSSKELHKSWKGSEILLENYPLKYIHQLKIGNNDIDIDKCFLFEDEGIIHLPQEYHGDLYIEYVYGIPHDEWMPLLELMVEYEMDTDWKKDASSIKEINVSINYDTKLSKGAVIQDMINNLRNKYSCVMRMI